MEETDRVKQLEVARLAAERAWVEGCPAASAVDEIAATSVRRWNSYQRRARSRADDLDRRTEDLVKGLVQRFEPEPELVGPLIADYQYLASKVASALSSMETP